MSFTFNLCYLSARRKVLIWKQMIFKSGWAQKSEAVHRLRILCDNIFANRKIATGILLALLFLLYFGPSWFFGRKSAKYGSSHSCLLQYATKTLDLQSRMSIDSYFDNENSAHEFAPYVSNGYFGLNVADKRLPSLYIKHDGAVSVPVPIDLIVNVDPKFDFRHEASAVALSIYTGSVTKITAYSVNGECAFVSSTIYAHRTRPELFVQDVVLESPILSNLAVEFNDALSRDQLVPALQDDQSFYIKSTKVTMQNSVDHYRLSVGRKKLPTQHLIKPNSQERISIITFLKLSDLLKSENASKAYEKRVVDEITQLKDNVLKDEHYLYKEHLAAWKELWQKGVSISHSKAPNTLNSELINATMYYLLSNAFWPIAKDNPVDNTGVISFSPGQCFNFHNTLLYPSRLWSDLKTTKDVLDVCYSWKLTLSKRGCSSLVQSGAHGLQQAIMLSLGGFKFTKQHLEFDVDPRDLHRDYHFSGLIFAPGLQLDVWVQVSSDNKPQMYLAVNSTTAAKKLYACDAGCLDEPQQLSENRVYLPVKLTDPLTPILYVTDDQKHIQELQHSIHVKEVVEAPPYEHHVIAMHKHGHRLGGLPTVFWVALVFLLVSFHLFLFKLIYNEYCREDTSRAAYTPVNRMRYAV